MNFTGLRGNEKVKAELSGGGLSHAYLISGPEGAGKSALAHILSKAMVCRGTGEVPCNACQNCGKADRGIHPDIIRLDAERDDKGREKREITVSQVRELLAGIYTLPNEAEAKVYIIESAGKMNASAQNALLKMLEEPPSFGAFLLIAENPLFLLPTIRSRCIELSLVPPHSPEETPPHELTEAFMSAFAAGGLTLVEFCAGMERMDRQSLSEFIDDCYYTLLDKLKNSSNALSRERLMSAAELFGDLRDYSAFNVGAGHISGMIAAKLTCPGQGEKEA